MAETGADGREPGVLKVGGRVGGEEGAALDLVAALNDGGRPVVVVHGGGPLVGDWATRLGLETRFERGLRVTDPATRDLALPLLPGLVDKTFVPPLGRRRAPPPPPSGRAR